MEVPLIAHIFTTFFMTGLCWFVQIVHYPLFRHIPLTDFPEYEKRNFVTAYITTPIMTIELLTGLWILYQNFNYLWIANVILLGIIGLSTFIFQVPIHLKLRNQASGDLIDRLILTNWIRTISWTVRSGLLLFFLIK